MLDNTKSVLSGPAGAVGGHYRSRRHIDRRWRTASWFGRAVNGRARVPVLVAEDPMHCVVKGTGIMLDNLDKVVKKSSNLPI